MFLSAERTALVNRTILSTFEQTSVAWQAIPHWDTGDPAQSRIRRDVAFAFTGASGTLPPTDPIGSEPVDIAPVDVQFRVRLAQATGPTPDALLASVLAQTVELARRFDVAVLGALGNQHKEAATGTSEADWRIDIAGGLPPTDPESTPGSHLIDLLAKLIDGRKVLEDSGYRADSCLVASTAHYKAVYQPVAVAMGTEDLLRAAAVNSVHRASQLDSVKHPDPPTPLDLSLLLGRRQEIGHRCGAQASPGEEPVDLAVSVPPSLEIVGDTAEGYLDLGLRLRYALRVKDPRGVVVLHSGAGSEPSGSAGGDTRDATT